MPTWVNGCGTEGVAQTDPPVVLIACDPLRIRTRPLAVSWRPDDRAADLAAAHLGITVADVSGTQSDFGGMTVNERLIAAGLLGQFDAALHASDRRQAIELLKQVAMSSSNAAATVDAVLANPSKYGFPRRPS